MSRGAVLLAVEVEGSLVGYSQLERDGDGAEVTQVYVLPEHRGRGLGTALTCAAMSTGESARDLWICADDEGRPKHLYARLGFRPAWTTMEFERVP